MSSAIKTEASAEASALRETSDSDSPQNSLKRKRGPPVPENKHEEGNYAKWKLWLISHYKVKQESTTAIRGIVDHYKTEENFQSGNHVIAPDVSLLGKLVKDIWGEKVTIVRRGSRDHAESHYLHLGRREGCLETELPKNWICVSKMDKKTCFVRLENFLLNKQRAVTEVIVKELDSGEHAFTIRANGTEQNLSSVLNFDLDNSLRGKDFQLKIVLVLTLLDSCELCKGYKPAAGQKIATSLPHNLYMCSVGDISINDTCDEETRAFSTDCLIFNKGNGGERCKNCNNLMRVDRQRQKRKSTRGEMISRNCNIRWLEKEEIEKQLDDCRRETRNAAGREKYWREKFHSESLE